MNKEERARLKELDPARLRALDRKGNERRRESGRSSTKRDLCACGREKEAVASVCVLCRHAAQRADLTARVERVLALRRSGLNNRQIARSEGVSPQAIMDLLVRARGRGIDIGRSPHR